MVALRSQTGSEGSADVGDAMPQPDAADWLTLQQAACELDISVSTARRMIRKGRLRNRIVPRRGGFAYLIYLPNSRHKTLGAHACHTPVADAQPQEPASFEDYARRRGGANSDGRSRDQQIEQLEEQVQHLSEALSRALRVKQKALPVGMGDPALNPTDPYARYRWLVRKRHWWPF